MDEESVKKHVTKLLSKEYAESQGCHNPKYIGKIAAKTQVLRILMWKLEQDRDVAI